MDPRNPGRGNRPKIEHRLLEPVFGHFTDTRISEGGHLFRQAFSHTEGSPANLRIRILPESRQRLGSLFQISSSFFPIQKRIISLRNAPLHQQRGSACHKQKKGTGRGCTPGSCLVCTAFRRRGPPFWGAPGAPSDGRMISAPTAWQLLYRPWSLCLNTAPARTGTGAASNGAGRRPPGGPRPRRRGRRRAAPPRSGCGWRTGPSWPAR